MSINWIKTVNKRVPNGHGVEMWRDDCIGATLVRKEEPRFEKIGRLVHTREETVTYVGAIHNPKQLIPTTFNTIADLQTWISAATSLQAKWLEQIQRDKDGEK